MTAQSIKKACLRKWHDESARMSQKYPTHMKKCTREAKGKAGLDRRKGRASAKDPCASQCAETVQRRIDNGDKTPRATMKASCLRKCHEKGPAAAAHSATVASAPPSIKRDVKALCNRYCLKNPDKSGCERQCNDGQIGPGKLAARFVEKKALTPTRLMYRQLKHQARQDRKAAGAARRAAKAAASQPAKRTRVDWATAVAQAKKTIGRRPR